MTSAVLPLAEIASFHAHLYFETPEQRATALALRERIAERFAVTLGRVHDGAIGPHLRAMYQVAFDVPVFERLVPWLMLNRGGLSVLVHPNTRHERDDHLVHALWMGPPLPLDGDRLERDNEAERPLAPNTSPTLPA